MNLKLLKKVLITTLVFLSLVQTDVAKAASSDSAIENEILTHINAYRSHHGLSQLKMDNNMVQEAKRHSADMANHSQPFGHKYFLTRIERLHAKIKNSGAGAENVAYNYKDAEDVVKNWLKSPGHKRNIDGNYNITGIGIARDKQGKIYFTQIFLRTNNNTSYAQRRPISRAVLTHPFWRART